MDFKSFQSQVVVLNKEEGVEVRKKYIEKFVDTTDEYYKKQIQLKYKFSDGYCYWGYLWDCIKNPAVIDKDYIRTISKGMGSVYVFWDVHSCDRIYIENYWRFAKEAVIKLSFDTLISGEEYLPEDIYIFDENITWTLIKTHEDINGRCYCLKSGQI